MAFDSTKLKTMLVLPLITLLAGSLSAQSVTKNGITYSVLSEAASTATAQAEDTCIKEADIEATVSINDKDYNVTIIPFNAFKDCDSLASVTIPSSVIMLGGNAFQNCTSLKSIDIPSNVKNIFTYVFSGCESLESVSIPDGISAIKEGLFNGCTSLKSVEIPQSVSSIEAKAFKNCKNLAQISIPAAVKEIGDSALYNCQSIETLYIPQNVATIGSNALDGMDKCSGFYVNYQNSNYKGDNGVLFTKNGIVLVKYPAAKTDKEYTIPESTRVLIFNMQSFQNCSNLEKVNVPVNMANNLAFPGCNALTDVNVASGNSSYKSVDGVVFTADGKELLIYPSARAEEYTIPEGTETFAKETFNNCAGLKAVSVPATLKLVGLQDYFANCKDLSAINIADGNAYYKSVDGAMYSKNGKVLIFYPFAKESEYIVPDDVIMVSGNAAADSKMKSVVTPENLGTIGENAFANSEIKSATVLSNDSTDGSIGAKAFFGCDSLETLSIPYIYAIDSHAFGNCKNLKSITRDIVGNPSASAFDGVDTENCVLYVPAGMTAAFRANECWNKFKNIEETGVNAINNATDNAESVSVNGNIVSVNGYKATVNVYTTDGKLVYSGKNGSFSLANGIYVVATGKKSFKIAVK